MKGHKINWKPDELSWIEAHRDMERPAAHKLFCETFNRSDIALGAYASLCKRKGWLTGRTGQYGKGHDPANKGKKMPFNANSAKTQFKKGHLGGKAKDKYKPIGTERLSKDGYLERKIHDGLPRQSRWRAVHLVRWEEDNGPIPKGHCLKCMDGNKSNTDPSNWTCISRALLPRLAGRWSTPYDSAPAEIKPTILAVAELAHAAKSATDERRQSVGGTK